MSSVEPKLDEYLEQNSCRLCLTVNPDQMVIMCFGNAVYEANAIKFPVAEVLNQHFWFKLRCERNANAFVCPPCWAKVEEFHEFYQSVRNRYPPQTIKPKCQWTVEFDANDAVAEQAPDFAHADIIEQVIDGEEHHHDDGDHDNDDGMAANIIEEDDGAHNDDGGGDDDGNAADPAGDSKQAVRQELDRLATDRKPVTRRSQQELYPQQQNMQFQKTTHQRPNAVIRAGWQRSSGRTAAAAPGGHDDTVDEAPDSPGADTPVDDSVLIAQYFTMQCELCFEPLTSLVAARQHYKLHHQQPGYLTCKCGKHFKRMTTIFEHCEFHASTAPHKCDECCSVFSTEKRLANHMQRRHGGGDGGDGDDGGDDADAEDTTVPKSGAKLNPHDAINRRQWPLARRTNRGFECSDCDQAFAMVKALRAHQRRAHMPDETHVFECFDCKRRFAYASVLRAHMLRHRAPGFQCTVCGKQYTSAHALAKHAVMHSAERPFKCAHCPKRFLRRSEVQSHERTHTDERPFVCEVCGMAFKQLANLTGHRSTKHLNEEKYGCDVCGRTFKRKRLLDYHTKVVHTGERPLECPTCKATFVYPQHFQKHLRIHTGEKPYACDICGKSFNSWDNRRAHRYVHSTKKLYECAACGAGFMRKPLLLLHMKEMGHESDTIVMNKPDVVVFVGKQEEGVAEQMEHEAQEQETQRAVEEVVLVEEFVIEAAD